MRIVKINAKTFDSFANKHSYRNFYQTSKYAKIVSSLGYKPLLIGILDNNKLIGASLLMLKDAFMNYKIATAPNGILLNYSKPIDKSFITDFKKGLKQFGIIYLTINPYIPVNVRNASGDILNSNTNYNKIIENIENIGFSKRKTEGDFESLIILDTTPDELIAKFDKRVRNKIRKSENLGVEIIKSESQKIKKLYNYLKGKTKFPLTYYEKLCISFAQDAEVYYAKLKTDIFLIQSRRNYEKEQDYNAALSEKIEDFNIPIEEKQTYLNQKMESDKLLLSYKNNLLMATELLKSNPQGIIVAGALIIKYDNAAYMVADGFDEKFGSLNASYLLKWQLINKYQNEGLKYINLGKIINCFDKNDINANRNDAKLGFNNIISEYIGQYEIVLNALAYNMYKKITKK